MAKRKFKESDFFETCDKLWQQFGEDRTAILDQYQELRGFMSGSPDRYAACGDTLAKFSDSLLKQTAQILEFVKLMKKDEKEDNSLSEEELNKISEEIKKK
jgi:hypothetical protein